MANKRFKVKNLKGGRKLQKAMGKHMCSDKVKYNLDGAVKMAEKQKQHIYRCPYCRDFHLTCKQTALGLRLGLVLQTKGKSNDPL